MLVHEVKVIDLSKSVWDKEHADPMKGEYGFTKKAYINYESPDSVPRHHVAWCRYEPRNNYRELNEWKIKWGYTPVKADDFDYVAEGIPPNGTGYFVLGDLILVKTELIIYLRQRAKDIEISQRMAKGKGLRSFHELMKQQGASIPESTWDEIKGDTD